MGSTCWAPTFNLATFTSTKAVQRNRAKVDKEQQPSRSDLEPMTGLFPNAVERRTRAESKSVCLPNGGLTDRLRLADWPEELFEQLTERGGGREGGRLTGDGHAVGTTTDLAV